MRLRSQRSEKGFTLVELMVVAAVIVCLLVVTVPALKSMLNSGQQAQALNIIRANLLVVRDFALTHSVPAGVRFQDDGRIVPIYATNSGLHDPLNYRTYNNGVLPGQQGAPFQMATIPGMAPAMMPGSFRVTPLDYTYQGYNDPGLIGSQSGWVTTVDWFTGQQWFLTSVLLFSSRGKAIQAKVQFPAGWAPATTGSYGKWLSPLTYSYQGYAGGANTMNGPSVSTDFRVFDYGAAQPYLSQASQGPPYSITPQYGNTYLCYPPNPSLTEAYRVIERTGTDFFVDSNSGRMIRKGGDVSTEQ
jgi:prepilin-type N-terminal cleavage/methylation domain-containing protein